MPIHLTFFEPEDFIYGEESRRKSMCVYKTSHGDVLAIQFIGLRGHPDYVVAYRFHDRKDTPEGERVKIDITADSIPKDPVIRTETINLLRERNYRGPVNFS